MMVSLRGIDNMITIVGRHCILLFLFINLLEPVLAQKTLLIEKIGTRRRFFYHNEDVLKLRTIKPDTIFRGHIWDIRENAITIQTFLPLDVQLDNIGYVYRQHRVTKKIGKFLCIGSAVIFGVITFDHLINHEQVFTQDVAYISLPFLGAGIITLSFSQERFKIGPRWKLKILDIPVH
jgi:hypothetical protein